MHAPLNPHRAVLNLVCTSVDQYFLCITTLHCASPNLSVHTHTPIFFAHYHSAPHITKFKCAQPTPLLSVHYHSAPCKANLSAHTRAPIFSVHHAFLVCTPAHICFYAHQFLVNFANFFPNFHHRHSTTMKFVQFHLDNTNSTSATTNNCWLTFLEHFFPKLNSQLRILIN
jgi:hypothetical protein